MSLGDAELGYSVDSGEMGLGLECVGCKWLRAPDLLSLMFHHAINCGAPLAVHWNKPSGAAKHVINVKIVGAKPWNGPAPGGTPKRNNRLPLTNSRTCISDPFWSRCIRASGPYVAFVEETRP